MMWTGVRDSLGIATRKHIELVLFLSPSSREEQAQHIDAYISSLRAVPSPYLDKGRLSESASRGKQLFTSLGCTRCHPPESYLTDMKRHSGKIGADDIGPWDGNWDTPSLHEVWRTGPYIHDGRTMDMVELLNKYEESRGLTMQDVRDLAEYVNSL